MTPEDVGEWLDRWVEDHLAVGSFDPQIAAALCRTQALEAGISDAQLTEAVQGDLAAFLAEEQADIQAPGSSF